MGKKFRVEEIEEDGTQHKLEKDFKELLETFKAYEKIYLDEEFVNEQKEELIKSIRAVRKAIKDIAVAREVAKAKEEK